MTIPMPGHHVTPETLPRVKQDVEMLTNLIHDHDAVFLLGDSREMRWLPTVLCTAMDKVTAVRLLITLSDCYYNRTRV